MIRRVDVICASACCRGIYFNKSPTNTDLQSSTQGGLLCLRPPPKKSKISLPTYHLGKERTRESHLFRKFIRHSFPPCARTFFKRETIIHNVRDAIFNQAIQLDGDDDEFVDAQATKAISKTRGEPNHARVFCQR